MAAISGYGGSAGGKGDIISWSINRVPFSVNEIKAMDGVHQASGAGGLTTVNIVCLSSLSIAGCEGETLTLSAGGTCGGGTESITVNNCVCTGSNAEVSADGFLQYSYDFSAAE